MASEQKAGPNRAVTRALIGGGGGGANIDIFAFCPTNFSVVIRVDFKAVKQA